MRSYQPFTSIADWTKDCHQVPAPVELNLPTLTDDFYTQLQLDQLTDKEIHNLFPIEDIHEEMNRQLSCKYLKLTEAGTPGEFWNGNLSPIYKKAETQKAEVTRRFRLISSEKLDQAMAAGKIVIGGLFSDEYLDQLDLYSLSAEQLNILRKWGCLTKPRIHRFEASISAETRPMLRRHYHGIYNMRFSDD